MWRSGAERISVSLWCVWLLPFPSGKSWISSYLVACLGSWLCFSKAELITAGVLSLLVTWGWGGGGGMGEVKNKRDAGAAWFPTNDISGPHRVSRIRFRSYHYGMIADKRRGWKSSAPQIILAQSILSASAAAAAAVKRHRVARVPTRMLRYRFPSCRSIRILMMRMSGPEPWTLPAGLLPQEAERRCDFVGVDGVKVAGVESLVGGDVSTSRQDTDGDLICCDGNKNQERDCCSEHLWHQPMQSNMQSL